MRHCAHRCDRTVRGVSAALVARAEGHEFRHVDRALDDLSGRALDQLADQEDVARILVRSQALARERFQDLHVERPIRRDDERDHLFTMLIVGQPDHRGLANAGVSEQHVLDLSWIDVVPGADDQLLLAIHEEQVAVLIQVADVPAEQPSVAVEHGARGLLVAPIPPHHARAADGDLAPRAVLDRAGWLLSGGVGYLDEDGYLFLVDRKKELIIRSGYYVYPREVEDVLLAHPGVREAAVVGLPL